MKPLTRWMIFTAVIVAFVIGALTLVVFLNMASGPKTVAPDIRQYENDTRIFTDFLIGFHQNHGRYPSVAEASQYLEGKKTAQGASLPRIDPWGTPYQYTLAATNRAFFSSAGVDKQFGTIDDL
ncbi:MAG: hypothetical protein WCO77_07710 [bacterium]